MVENPETWDGPILFYGTKLVILVAIKEVMTKHWKGFTTLDAFLAEHHVLLRELLRHKQRIYGDWIVWW